ncbi:MAG: YCF48-related protein [Spirochaetia bacterium]
MPQLLAVLCILTIPLFLTSGFAALKLKLKNRISFIFLLFMILNSIWLMRIFFYLTYPEVIPFYSRYIFPLVYLLPAVILSLIVGFTTKKMSYIGWKSLLFFIPAVLGVVSYYSLELNRTVSFTEKSTGQVYSSPDGGKNWKLEWRGKGPVVPHKIIAADSSGERLYITLREVNHECLDPAVWRSGGWTGEGILRTVNRGKTWELLDEGHGLQVTTVTSLACHPENPEVLIAGAGELLHPDRAEEFDKEIAGGMDNPMGIYRTEDGGDSWEQVFSFPGPDNVFEIVTALGFSEADSSTAYAATPRCLLKSTDSGKTWNLVSGGAFNSWIPRDSCVTHPIELCPDPEDPERLVVFTAGSGMFESRNGGLDWSIISSRPSSVSFWDCTWIPEKNLFFGCGEQGLWRSDLSLRDWISEEVLERGEFSRFSALHYNPESKLLTAAPLPFTGFITSKDYGKSWNFPREPEGNREEGPLEITCISAAPSDKRVMYASTANVMGKTKHEPFLGNGFILKSEDGGGSWNYLPSPGLEEGAVLDLAVSPFSPQKIFAASSTGLYHSFNGGTEWTRVELPGIEPGTIFRTVDISPADEKKLLAGFDGGILYSADGGSTWSSGNITNSFLDEERLLEIQDVAFHPENPEFTAAIDFMNNAYLESMNGGKTWLLTRLNDARRVHRIAFKPGNESPYILTDGTGIIAPAENFLRKGPPAGRLQDAELRGNIALTADAVGGVFISFDAGKTWETGGCRNSEGNYIADGASCLTLAQKDPVILYTGGEGLPLINRWIYRGQDRVNHDFSAEIPVTPRIEEGFTIIKDLYVSPRDPDFIVASLEDIRWNERKIITPFPGFPEYTVASPFIFIYHTVSLIFFITAFVLTGNLFRQKRAGIIEVSVICMLSALIIPLLLGAETSMSSMTTDTRNAFVPVYMLLFSIILIYLIRRYNLEIIQPRRIARDLIAGIQTPILVADFTGKIIAVNAKTAITFGYHPREIETSSLNSLFLQVNGMDVDKIDLKDYASGSKSFHSVCLGKGGKKFECVLSFSYLKNKVEQDLGYIMSITQNPEFETVENRFGFTEREMEIVKLIMRGLSYQDIAEQLYISLATVKTHVHHIYKKSGAKNRIHLMQLLK